MKHLLTATDITNKELLELFREAEAFRSIRNGERYGLAEMKPTGFEGKVMASLFFEPSTRTRVSFEIAMLRLGGSVSCAPEGRCLSLSKGESLADTIEVVGRMADVIVVRATESLDSWFHTGTNRVLCPVINAGDGPNNHPTQAFLDAYTVWRHYNQPDCPFPADNRVHLVIGDLGKSRAIRSYLQLHLRQSNHKFYLFDNRMTLAKVPGIGYLSDICYLTKTSEVNDLLPCVDVMYLNRIQSERHGADAGVSQWTLTERATEKMKDAAIILNPGPRKDEMPYPVCRNGRVKMLDQVENGMFLRMALLRKLCGAAT